jgi:alpha-mannosidase
MGVVSFDDPWGSWGGHEGEPEAKDISQDPCHWSIGQVSVLETGPLRAVLWVEFIHGASRVALTLRLENGQEAVHVQGRLFWAERGRRLKLVLPVEGQATFDVPGGAIQRDACGEVPGGRWVRAGTAENGWVLATDSIYNYDQKDGVLRATVVRSTRYAWNPTDAPSEQPWRPYADLGEHRFALSLAPHSTNPDHLANALETPPVAWVSPAHAGTPSPTGSIASLAAPWRLLALKPADCGEGFILRAQNASGLPAHGEFTCLHRKVSLGALAPWEIGTWLLDGRALARAQRTDVSELPVPAKTAVVEAACLEAAAL